MKMFSLLNKIKYIVATVFFIFMIQCSTGSPVESDKMMHLMQRLDRMLTKMDANMQSREVENLTERLDRMQTTVDYENLQLTERLKEMKTKLDAENVQLTERLNEMKTKMDAENDKWTKKFGDLEAENEKLKTQKLPQDQEIQLIERVNKMETKLDAENDKWTKKFSDLEAENEKLKTQKLPQDQEEKWTKKQGDLEAEIEKLKVAKLQQDEELKHLKIHISHSNFSISAFKEVDGQPPSRFLTNPPTSCQELKENNYLLPSDGLHLLKKDGKVKVAFCTFITGNNRVSEKLIGQVDVKTKSVHFYVQKNFVSKTSPAVITFDKSELNEGGAFNLTSGIFTAPVPGIYHFHFQSETNSDSDMDLQVNGEYVDRASTGRSVSINADPLLSVSFRLAAGDKVNLVLGRGAITHLTHFGGWLVEEDSII